MKKIITILLLFVALGVQAQGNVTKFLGIPVDGSKEEMIEKLKSKGFVYNSRLKCLEGEFNGYDVYIYVVTNNNKVFRIMVADSRPTSESQIKIRFNKLCGQFSRNKKYIALDERIIPDSEDISYEMSVSKKEYQSSYMQIPDDFPIDRREDLLSLNNEIINKKTDKSNGDLDKAIDRLYLLNNLMAMQKMVVWLSIKEIYGDYYIAMYYDNEYNRANGEDL